jgi:Glycerol-3-phosphate cytidylyltransferase (EC 2.7.7.39)
MSDERATDDGEYGVPIPPDATAVVAQGTFDLLHPGHVHYLREAAAMGDHLTVIVARTTNVTHKPSPVVPVEQRRRMVAALGPVDDAVLGHPEDIFVPIEAIDPDVLALGYDQHHDPDAIADELDARGIDCAVRRASGRQGREDELTSTTAIVERVLDRRDDASEN